MNLNEQVLGLKKSYSPLKQETFGGKKNAERHLSSVCIVGRAVFKCLCEDFYMKCE